MAHQKLLENVPNDEREYVSYIEAVKNALSRRDSMQIEYELTVDVLAKKRLEKDQVQASLISSSFLISLHLKINVSPNISIITYTFFHNIKS